MRLEPVRPIRKSQYSKEPVFENARIRKSQYSKEPVIIVTITWCITYTPQYILAAIRYACMPLTVYTHIKHLMSHKGKHYHIPVLDFKFHIHTLHTYV